MWITPGRFLVKSARLRTFYCEALLTSIALLDISSYSGSLTYMSQAMAAKLK
jgi:hypothetical protein